ncbi:hypothetical protein HN385_05665 [archaeon]|jgi:hypothetical protein|nr:hypothetical protein [archaeon]MBT3451467.1 hypothetical protein [archaeon]MBT6868539.1 hypothetical protein [archaeon]MBT7193073.1 hypothetical protein [archaeon]MBT7381162.1 hypothetical protein [archaeon]
MELLNRILISGILACGSVSFSSSMYLYDEKIRIDTDKIRKEVIPTVYVAKNCADKVLIHTEWYEPVNSEINLYINKSIKNCISQDFEGVDKDNLGQSCIQHIGYQLGQIRADYSTIELSDDHYYKLRKKAEKECPSGDTMQCSQLQAIMGLRSYTDLLIIDRYKSNLLFFIRDGTCPE